MNFAGDSEHPDDNRQQLVDAAFLVHGILRAPRALWLDLDPETQQFVIDAVKQCQRHRAKLQQLAVICRDDPDIFAYAG